MEMKIEPGQFIRKDIVPNEELIKSLALDTKSLYRSREKHYIILSVADNQLEVKSWNDSPTHGSQVFAYDDVAALYEIVEIPTKDVKSVPIQKSCKINGLDGKITVATKYLWGDKEYIHPIGHLYWNGRQWADNSDFYKSMLEEEQ